MVIMMHQLPGLLRVTEAGSQIGPLLPGQRAFPLVGCQHPLCQPTVPVVLLHDFPQELAHIVHLHIDFKPGEVHQGRFLPLKQDIVMDILPVAEVFAIHGLLIQLFTAGSLQKLQGIRSILENGFGALKI